MPIPFLLAAIAAQTAAVPQDRTRAMEPPEAIALADSARRGKTGRFAMTVAATGRAGGGVFLNSTPDYRAPDDLSFRLSPNVTAALRRRYGQPPETFLRGKHVVVDGTIRRELIANRVNPHLATFNRWQHTVRILFPSQIVSVD